ncbi:MAG TPA: DUF4160 domain-containing protein [Clostridiales bacterium]|nr:MAG: hypothetical protein A2Y22_00880 [Clostridiales bacterium GWD2_32_59]HAN10225.1 DUF4160 domain-containing protein [Clostridiales bacterium]
MPVISRFYGIVIKMFFIGSEHNPPHFHAIYGEYIAEFNIKTLDVIEGDLPTKARNLVIEWAEKNQKELMKIWETQEFVELKPLE